MTKKTYNKDCRECKYLTTKVHDKGYPYAHECLKYGNSAFQEEFNNKKTFIINYFEDVIIICVKATDV